MDGWTKSALWLIALALWGILLRPLIAPAPAGAAREKIDVNIAAVGGSRLGFKGPIPVVTVRAK
jgi:hypothetical protein